MRLSRQPLQADPNNGQYTVQKWAASAADAARIRLQFTEVGAIDWAGALLGPRLAVLGGRARCTPGKCLHFPCCSRDGRM